MFVVHFVNLVEIHNRVAFELSGLVHNQDHQSGQPKKRAIRYAEGSGRRPRKRPPPKWYDAGLHFDWQS